MRRGSPKRGGPGLLNTMGRTAVIAGTATVVSNSVSNSQAKAAQQRATAEQQKAAAEQARIDNAVQQALAQQAAPPAAAPPAAPAPATGGADRIAQLQQLAELKQSGILSDAEFEAEKARILGS